LKALVKPASAKPIASPSPTLTCRLSRASLHETFLASIETTSFGASYAAPVALINALLAACGQVRRAETMEIVREMSEEQRHGSRWFGNNRAYSLYYRSCNKRCIPHVQPHAAVCSSFASAF